MPSASVAPPMFRISGIAWNAVAGASGYRIHAGKETGLYTEMRDVGNATSGYIDVPEGGTWYVAIAAYDADGYEGEYSTPVALEAYGGPPVGNITLRVR